MKVTRICAWCKRPIGLRSRLMILLGLKSQISHGICGRCKNEQLDRLSSSPEDSEATNVSDVSPDVPETTP
jgi:hypothetical protein